MPRMSQEYFLGHWLWTPTFSTSWTIMYFSFFKNAFAIFFKQFSDYRKGVSDISLLFWSVLWYYCLILLYFYFLIVFLYLIPKNKTYYFLLILLQVFTLIPSQSSLKSVYRHMFVWVSMCIFVVIRYYNKYLLLTQCSHWLK